MDWHKLLSTERLGREANPAADVRSEFQRDFDRIVYSSAFRRLQDKTQVFPLAESDYVVPAREPLFSENLPPKF